MHSCPFSTEVVPVASTGGEIYTWKLKSGPPKTGVGTWFILEQMNMNDNVYCLVR